MKVPRDIHGQPYIMENPDGSYILNKDCTIAHGVSQENFDRYLREKFPEVYEIVSKIEGKTE